MERRDLRMAIFWVVGFDGGRGRWKEKEKENG